MIAVVDSGTGNLRSVVKALVTVGGDAEVTADPEVVRRADRIVVPGQGAFRDTMRGLDEGGLRDAVLEVVRAGRPYLGLCLGLEILFEESEEQGPVAGLGLLPGRVVRFAAVPGRKVPHMGWNEVTAPPRHRDDPLLRGLPRNPHFYFVHSYLVVPAQKDDVALETEYGETFCSAIRHDNLFAVQFHPEKSQTVGLQLLANFVSAR